MVETHILVILAAYCLLLACATTAQTNNSVDRVAGKQGVHKYRKYDADNGGKAFIGESEGVLRTSAFVNLSQGGKGEEMSHSNFAVAAIDFTAAATVVTSLERIWRSSGDCSEGSDGEKSDEAGEHVWQ